MEKSGSDATKALILDVPTPGKVTQACSPAFATTPTTAAGDSPAASSPASASAASPAAEPLRKIDFHESGISLQGTSADLEASGSARAVPLAIPENDGRVCWEAFFVNMPMFCGYAALFGLQHEIKTKFNFSDDDIESSRMFGVAVSFLYIFNLIFRFSHNIVFGALGPRGRTYMAMCAMMASMLVIVLAIFIFESFSLYWVMLAYALGGVGVGTFESNFLCCLTPLGPRTKHIAITAIPVGITSILVGGFFAMGPPFGVSAQSIYVVVAVMVFCAILLFAFRVPHDNQSASTQVHGVRQFVDQIRCWRLWLPLVWTLPVATMIDMFTLSAFSPGVALYIYDQKTVTLWSGMVLPKDDFFVIYNTFNMLGGLLGRVLSYRVKPRHPVLYTCFSIFGGALLLLKIPVLAPLSTFIVMIGDGLIYGAIARRIDATVPREYNLVALSFWLFIGDFGSVTGSNLISYIKVWVVGH